MANRRAGKSIATTKTTKGKGTSTTRKPGKPERPATTATGSTGSAAAGPPVTNWEELPLLLRPWPDIARLLRISRTRVYTLLPTMPGVVKLSRRQYRVNRDALRSFLESRPPRLSDNPPPKTP